MSFFSSSGIKKGRSESLMDVIGLSDGVRGIELLFYTYRISFSPARENESTAEACKTFFCPEKKWVKAFDTCKAGGIKETCPLRVVLIRETFFSEHITLNKIAGHEKGKKSLMSMSQC